MLEQMFLLNWWVATGVLFLEIITIFHIGLVLILFLGNADMKNKLRETINKNWNYKMNLLGFQSQEKYLVFVIFLFSLFSSLLTLVYSEYFLQIPCALCWWQRVFMYGIVVISATALWSDRNGNKLLEIKGIIKYILNFSILGFVFAIYQHAMQMLALYGTHLPCPVSGEDCSKMTLFEYGHITFPWMAVVLFAFFITIILLQKKLNK